MASIRNIKRGAAFTAGGVKTAKRTNTLFDALASDSEEETLCKPAAPVAAPATLESLASDPIIALYNCPDLHWGDIRDDIADPLEAAEEAISWNSRMEASRRRAATEPTEGAEYVAIPVFDPEVAEEELWAQPWAAALGLNASDNYNTERLTDADYTAMMTWLFAKGWDVESDPSRTSVRAYPDNLPSRVWFPPVAAPAATHGCCSGHRAKKVIPRFCRAGADCADEGCCFEHGDTIHKLNQACQFGDACGAGDAGKRATCIRLHPGEVWSSSLVIHRPAKPVVVEVTA
jgi:hypothetical protein